MAWVTIRAGHRRARTIRLQARSSTRPRASCAARSAARLGLRHRAGHRVSCSTRQLERGHRLDELITRAVREDTARHADDSAAIRQPTTSRSDRDAGRAGPSSRPRWRDLDGILLLDKPTGIDLNAALQRVRRLFRARKAGHAGSLDPLATGMLPICFGEATKVCGHLLDADKAYRVAPLLGAATDTGDAEGQVGRRHQPGAAGRCPALEAVLAALLRRAGPQVAAHVLGAEARGPAAVRAGPRTARRSSGRRGAMHIHDIEVAAPGRTAILEFEVRCRKGTYIRTLVEDIAAGTGHLGPRHRPAAPAVEPFGGRPMVTLAAVEAWLPARARARRPSRTALLPAGRRLRRPGPAATWTGRRALHLSRGGPVPRSGAAPARPRSSTGPAGGFLGLVEASADGRVRSRVCSWPGRRRLRPRNRLWTRAVCRTRVRMRGLTPRATMFKISNRRWQCRTEQKSKIVGEYRRGAQRHGFTGSAGRACCPHASVTWAITSPATSRTTTPARACSSSSTSAASSSTTCKANDARALPGVIDKLGLRR